MAKQENAATVLTSFFQGLFSIPADHLDLDQSERTHWIELWKNLRMDCVNGMLISTEKLERVLSKLKNAKESPDPDHSGCLEDVAPGMFEKNWRDCYQ